MNKSRRSRNICTPKASRWLTPMFHCLETRPVAAKNSSSRKKWELTCWSENQPREPWIPSKSLCKEYNIKVAIHDHPQPSHYWNPETVLAAIKDRGPLMGACADTGHWVRSGLDPVGCLKDTARACVRCLHFKDLNAKGRKGHDVPWGTGVGNCKGMMEELQRQGFRGAFLAEYEYHFENSMPGAGRVREVLRPDLRGTGCFRPNLQNRHALNLRRV